MTTLYTENFEGGTAPNAITNSNTVFTTVTGAQGWKFDTTHRVAGNAGYYNTGATTTAAPLSKTLLADQTTVHVEFDFWGTVPATTNSSISTVLNGTAIQANIRYKTDGHFAITNSSGTQLAVTTAAYPSGTRAHLEWNVNQTAGTQELRIYTGTAIGTSTPTESVSGTYAGLVINKVNHGIIAGANTNQEVWFDAILVADTIPSPLPTSSVVIDEHFDTGPAGAALVPTGTTGSNVAFDVVAGTWTFDTTHRTGSTGFAARGDSGAGVFTSITKTFSASTDTYHNTFRGWVSARPNVTTTIRSVRNGTVLQASVRLGADGSLSLVDGTRQTALSTVKIVGGTQFALEWNISKTTTTQQLLIYLGANVGGTTPDEVLTGTYTGLTMTSSQTGAVAGAPANFVIWIDDFYSDTTYPPPLVGTARILDEHFNNGTDGAAVTTLNTTFGAPSGTITFSSARSVTSTLSARCDTTSAATFTSMPKTFTATDTIYVRFYMWLAALPAANTILASARTSTAAAANLVLAASGKFIIQDAAVGVATSTSSVRLSAWNRLEWELNATDPTGAQQTLDMFYGGNSQGSTANDSISGGLTATTMDSFRIGVVATPPASFVVFYDDVAIDTTNMPAPVGTAPAVYQICNSLGVWVDAKTVAL